MAHNSLRAVFFDIGDTLLRRDPTTDAWVPVPGIATVLRDARDLLGLKIGVITTLGTLSNDDARALLDDAGLWSFITANGLISEHDADAAKPAPEIYRFAADRFGVPVGQCLYVGESLIEVIGALNAGMQAVLKPT